MIEAVGQNYLQSYFKTIKENLANSGTAAIHLSLLILGIKPGDRVKVEIENIGFIENNIIQEPKSTTKY